MNDQEDLSHLSYMKGPIVTERTEKQPGTIDEMYEEVGSSRVEDYGDFRVSLNAGKVYVMDIANDVFETFDCASNSKVAETIDEIADGRSIEEALETVYSERTLQSGCSAEGLSSFDDLDGDRAEDLQELSNDWLIAPKDAIAEELSEDIEVIRDAKSGGKEVIKLVAARYGLRQVPAREMMSDYGIEWNV